MDVIAHPLSALPRLLADPAFSATVERRFLGHQVRRDAWSCRDHAFGWQVLYLVQEGVITGSSASVPFTLGPGSLLWLPPQTQVSMTWPALLVFAEIWFRLEDAQGRQHAPDGMQVIEGCHALRTWFDAVADEADMPGPASADRLRHLLALLAIDAQRRNTAPPPGLDAAQRGLLAAYVRQHLRQRPAPGELARVVGLSHDHFSRVFRRTYGCPPRSWIAAERVRAAARVLVESSMPVHAIAAEFGYANVAQFSRQFTALHGCSPRAWRAR